MFLINGFSGASPHGYWRKKYSENTQKMREKKIEQYLRKKVIERGGICWKFTSPGTVGVPDRLVIFPGNPPLIFFIELKQPKGKLSEMQKLRIQQLRDVGCIAEVLWSKDDVNSFLDKIPQ